MYNVMISEIYTVEISAINIQQTKIIAQNVLMHHSFILKEQVIETQSNIRQHDSNW